MNIYAEEGDKVKYTGCSDSQVGYGGHDDPREHLEIDKTYEIKYTVVHDFHTEVYLKGYEQYDFNSVCFEDEEDK